MDFIALESAGKKLFERFPVIKRGLKRAYQLGMFAVSRDRSQYEGNVTRVSPNDKYEYFYGYYDKSPWSLDERYILCLRVKNSYKAVAPKDFAQIILLDTKHDNRPIKIAVTHSWNVQQGCMAQWLGPDFNSRIIYNDYRNEKYCSVIFNVNTKKEEKVLPLPVYDVSRDGSFALSLDFSRLHRLRPGYGYSNIEDFSKQELCPDKACIWKLDLNTGEINEIIKYTNLAAFETDACMINAEHKVNHLMISPNGERFMVLHRWFEHGHKHTRLVTLNCDGTGLYNLSDDRFVSHCYWKNDKQILSFLRKNESGDHYYLLDDKTTTYKMYWPRLNTDGHCSYSPDNTLVVTDSYPNRNRKAFVYICSERQEQPVRIAKVASPFRYDNDTRCDLHPRWDHKGEKVCIDSVHEGKRGLYVIPVEQKNHPPAPVLQAKHPRGRYKIVYVITRCKNSGPMNQTLNIIRNLDRNIYEPILVTLFLEDLGNSMIQKYKDTCSQCYCLELSKVSSVLQGKKKLQQFLESVKPDLVQGLGMPPYTLSLAYENTVHLVTLRNYCFEDYPDKYGKFIGNLLAIKDIRLIKKQYQRGETFVTCSSSLADIYQKKHGLDLSYIRNGVDISKYNKCTKEEKKELKKKLKLSKYDLVFIYTGQVIERKDQEAAIRCFLQTDIGNAALLILGAGSNLKLLKDKYKQHSNVIFTGSVGNVNEYLTASDLYISTSKSEGLPNGVLEAMAVGLPVLLSNIPQHQEIISVCDQIGFTYTLGQDNELIEKIKLVASQDLYKMGESSHMAAVQFFSDYRMSHDYQTLYQKLIKKE